MQELELENKQQNVFESFKCDVNIAYATVKYFASSTNLSKLIFLLLFLTCDTLPSGEEKTIVIQISKTRKDTKF